MNWAVPILISLAILGWAYLLLRRNRHLADAAMAKVDVQALAIEQSPSVVGITDQEGNLEYVNPAFESASGYSAEELLGQNPRVLKSGVTPDSDYGCLWQTIIEGGVWVGELCNKKKDGQLYWEWASISGLKDRKGKISHYVKVAEDITDRKKAGAARAESDKRFRTIFELAGAGMALIDRQGHWLQVNDQLCKIVDYSRDELVGRSFLEITPEEDHDQEINWNKSFEAGELKSATLEKRYLAKGGREVWVEVTATLVRDALGIPEYYICLIKDVTRQKTAEDAAAKQQNQLAHMARVNTLQQLASELAHEIDQPLCAILAASQASLRLLDADNPEALDDARAALKIVAKQAGRAGAVVDSIREFSRKQSLEKKLFGLSKVIDQTVSLLEADLRRHQVEIRVDSPAGAEAYILGDPVLAAQVLVNLCRNGADAMIEKNTRLKVLTIGWITHQGEVRIQVNNSGPPIADELVERIFMPFFTTRPEGLGLGLSLSRSIVESLGGQLWVEPGEEEGTTFHVVLPVQDEPKLDPKNQETI